MLQASLLCPSWLWDDPSGSGNTPRLPSGLEDFSCSLFPNTDLDMEEAMGLE
jgi:hypothetical protein